MTKEELTRLSLNQQATLPLVMNINAYIAMSNTASTWL